MIVVVFETRTCFLGLLLFLDAAFYVAISLLLLFLGHGKVLLSGILLVVELLWWLLLIAALVFKGPIKRIRLQ